MGAMVERSSTSSLAVVHSNQTVCGSSGVPTNQLDKKIALTPCGAGLFAYYGGLRSRITGDVVIFREIYPKNREMLD